MGFVDSAAQAIASASDHRMFFFTVTAVMASLVAVGALWLWWKALRDEHWILYFGLGFFFFAVQYAPLSLIWILSMAWSTLEGFMSTLVVEQLRVLASALNNLFLLAAAVALLWPQFKPRPRHWIEAITLMIVTVFWDWLGIWKPWHRVPDASLSATTLGLLGFAFFTNISPRRLHRTAFIALAGAGLYAFLNILFALAPPLMEGDLSPTFRGKVIDNLAGPGLDHPSRRDARLALDTFLIALAFFLKFLLASGGFVLIMRVLVLLSPRTLSGLLAEVSRGEGSFFTNEGGIVRAVGESFGADSVKLYYRMPGLSEPRVAQWKWRRQTGKNLRASSHKAKGRAKLEPLSSIIADREGRVLAIGEPVVDPHYGSDRLSLWRRLDSEAISLLVVPIRYHGNVTGCLTLEWQTPYAFTKTAIHHAERLAELLCSAVEARRRLAALWRWGPQIKESERQIPLSGYERILRTFTELLRDNLGALAVGISTRAGFDPAWGTYGPRGFIGGRQHEDRGARLERLRRLQGKGSESVKELRTPLRMQSLCIGFLQILLPGPRDIAVSIVSLDEQSLRAFANLVSTSIFDAVESGLSTLLNRFQNSFLHPDNRTRQKWFAVLRAGAHEAGIRWIVARSRDTGASMGDKNAIRLVDRFVDSDLAIRGHYRLKAAEEGVHHVLRIPLTISKYDLWMGIVNPFFGPELNPKWPWKKFLVNLAQTADAALSYLSAGEELSQLRLETDQFRGLLKASEDAATFIHEIRNIARNFQFAAQSLEDARRRELLNGPEDIETDISAMLESASRLYELADGLMRPSALDGKAAYPLVDLVDEVEQLFRPLLSARHVRLETRLARSLMVSASSHAVHMALVTIVSNSLDAFDEAKMGTCIWIEAWDGKEQVVCQVRDDGPGIKPSIESRLFEPGFSTKGSTGGKGLFLARSRLQEAGGDIVLTSGSQGATFTIYLPKLKRKEPGYGKEFSLDCRRRGPSTANP